MVTPFWRLGLALVLCLPACLASTHRIPDDELARLAHIAPEARGQAVHVVQEYQGETAPPGATPVGGGGLIVAVPVHGDGVAPPPRPSRPGAGAGGSSAGNSKEMAIRVLTYAAIGVIALAVTEGQRFDGDVELHPMHPVHLFLRDGRYLSLPLSQIDPGTAAFTTRAVVRDTEGPWRRLRRSPLSRPGLAYSVLLGASSSVGVGDELGVGPSGHIQLGYFPQQHLGVVGDLFFGWREDRFGNTLYDTRSSLELQAFPVATGRIHAGGFGAVGLGAQLSDSYVGGDRTDLALSAGVQLQLDLTTFLALTGRAGVTWAYGDNTRELTVGLSVY
jgi:hypothetical protein